MERYAIVPHDGIHWVVIYDTRFRAQVEDVSKHMIRHTRSLGGYPVSRVVRYGTTDWQRVFCTPGPVSERSVLSRG